MTSPSSWFVLLNCETFSSWVIIKFKLAHTWRRIMRSWARLFTHFRIKMPVDQENVIGQGECFIRMILHKKILSCYVAKSLNLAGQVFPLKHLKNFQLYVVVKSLNILTSGTGGKTCNIWKNTQMQKKLFNINNISKISSGLFGFKCLGIMFTLTWLNDFDRL